MNEREKQFLLLQINDALFPIGGYAHSYGLETYIQKGLVNNAETAVRYIKHMLRYNICYTDLLAVSLAYQYAENEEVMKLTELSEVLTAIKFPMEIRAASHKLGSRFVKTVKAFSIQPEGSIFLEYIKKSELIPVHHTIAYGVFCASAEILYEDVLEAFLYAQVSAMVTNCVKSIPLSQTAGQKMLFGFHGVMEEILAETGRLSKEDLGRSAPGFDIRSMQHEALYSRLYMS